MNDLLEIIESLMAKGFTREARSLLTDMLLVRDTRDEDDPLPADDELTADDYLWIEQGPTWRPRNIRFPDTPPKDVQIVFPVTEDRYQ